MRANHLLLEPGSIEPVVLTCGDPMRAERVASLMQNSREVASHREYRTFVGEYMGQRLTVASHGVGAAGAAICFEELIQLGAKVLIRLGTCGSFRNDLGQGDHLIANAAVRQDGVTPQLVPLSYPAVASWEVCDALARACEDAGTTHRQGMVLSTDMFYAGVLPTNYEMHARAGVMGVEMECSALFIIAWLRGVQAGALLTMDGRPLQKGDYAPHGEKVAVGTGKMLEIGLAAAAEMAAGI